MRNFLILLPIAILLSACGNDSKNVVTPGIPGGPTGPVPGPAVVQVSALAREQTGFDAIKFVEPRLINGGNAIRFWAYGSIFGSWTNFNDTFDSHVDAICAALAGFNYRYESHTEAPFVSPEEPGAVLQLINGNVAVKQIARFGDFNNQNRFRQTNRPINAIVCTTSQNLGRNRQPRRPF
jgi:hypothetical protein